MPGSRMWCAVFSSIAALWCRTGGRRWRERFFSEGRSARGAFSMSVVQSSRRSTSPLPILLHPDVIPIVDVFRTFGGPEEGCDLALLESPELTLAGRTNSGAAKAIISDALLLAFGLWRKRNAPLICEPVGTRTGSLDEYRLVTWITASRIPESRLAQEASISLGMSSPDYLATLAAGLIQKIDRAGLSLEAPSLSAFRGVNGGQDDPPGLFPDFSNQSSFGFRF